MNQGQTRMSGVRDRLVRGAVLSVESDRGPHVVRVVRGRPLVHQALCPHRGGPLEDAYVVRDLLICSWHRSTFRCSDGTPAYGPAARGIDVVPARFDGADLVIDWPAPA